MATLLPTRKLRWCAALLPLATVVAACGGDDSGGDTVLSTPTTTEATTTSTTEAEVTVESSVVVNPTSTTTTTIVETTTTAPRAGQGQELTDSARISTIGLGPVFVGDLLTDVEEKLGVELALDESRPVRDACRYYTVPGGPPGVSIMAAFDRVARVDIEPPSVITTRSGAGIGSTEDQIVELFGDKIQATDLDDGTGRRLAFVPVDEKDANLRIIFETDENGVVQRYRTGQLPEVDYVGC